MKLPKDNIFRIAESGQVETINRAKLIKEIKAKAPGLDLDYYEYMLKNAEKDVEVDYDSATEDDGMRKAMKAAEKAIRAAIKEHFDCAKDAEKEAEKEKELKAKEGRAIVLAGAGGNKTAELFVTTGQDGLTDMVKNVTHGKFTSDSTGLTLNVDEGKVTKEDLAFLIGSLSASSEGVDRVRSSVVWSLGDACIFAEEHFEDGSKLIEQVANTTGKQKHTIREAMKLCRAFAKEDRIEELTATHHQEINNYKDGIRDKKKLFKIIALVKEGEVESVIEIKGKQVEQRKPLSCAKTRALLQEAAGKKRKDKGDSKPSANGYLYIGNLDGVVYRHAELSTKACSEDYTVIDLGAMSVLSKEGKPYYRITELDAGLFEKEEEEKKPEKAPAKVKKGKKEETSDLPE